MDLDELASTNPREFSKKYLYVKGEAQSRVWLAVLTYCVEHKIYPSETISTELAEQGFIDNPDVLKVGAYLGKRLGTFIFYKDLAKHFLDYELPL